MFYSRKNDKKNVYVSDRFSALIGIGMSLALSSTLIAIKGCSSIKENGVNMVTQEINKSQNITFLPGEHIISIPVKNSLKENDIVQYPYYEGYKCVGVSMDDNVGILVYENIDTVYCVSNKINNDGDYVYSDFGSVEKVSNQDNNLDDEKNKIFDVGQHIISVPVSDPTGENQQYFSHEGYEIIDVSFFSRGDYKSFENGHIFFTNTVPVRCRKVDGAYTKFGEVIEKEKVLIKK